MKPYFSVIIPLYNKEEHIKDTLDSVWSQSFTNFEVIIVNDGSTDGSLIKVESINDERLRIFSTENQGVSHARNYGISKANADLIAFLDADDIWFKHHLQDLKDLYEQFPGCGMYCKAYEKMYFNTKKVNAKFNNIDHPFSGKIDNYFENSLIDSIAWTSALAIPKAMFDLHGNFDNNLRSGQDTDLWIRLALKSTVAFSTKISVRRIFTLNHNHLSLSSNKSQRIQIINRYKSYEKDNISLKKYLDLNRFAIAIERKSNRDLVSFKTILQDLDMSSLNFKQKILLKMPSNSLRLLKKIQYGLIKNKLYFSAFR